MSVAASSRAARLEARPAGGWQFAGWASPRVVAGMTDRHVDREVVLSQQRPDGVIEAEQVHGASVAVIDDRRTLPAPLAGCDALITCRPGVALVVRTADCLPIFVADAARGIVAIAHAWWRGLAAQLPMRVVAAMRHVFQCQADALDVAIGPAIRSCCYEVGPEFAGHFGAFVTQNAGRRTCDLIGVAVDQLRRSGVRAERIFDSGVCTSCDVERWFSLRREGPATGRMTSLIMLRR